MVTSEDRMRAEHLARIKRRLENENKPSSWSEVFIEAATDDRYWDEQVRRPANKHLANGTKGNVNTPDEDDPNKLAQQQQHWSGKGGWVQQAWQPKGGKGKGTHPKKDAQGRFITTGDGVQVCYAWCNGGCQEPCPAGRAHVCQ